MLTIALEDFNFCKCTMIPKFEIETQVNASPSLACLLPKDRVPRAPFITVTRMLKNIKEKKPLCVLSKSCREKTRTGSRRAGPHSGRGKGRACMLVLTKCIHVNVSGKRPVGRSRLQGTSY